jgi:hypothetical protein
MAVGNGVVKKRKRKKDKKMKIISVGRFPSVGYFLTFF